MADGTETEAADAVRTAAYEADAKGVTFYAAGAVRRVRTYSKLRLYAALSKEGLWEPLMAWLATQEVEGMNARTAFDLAQVLSDAHPLFAPMLAAAKTALGVTEDEAEAILAEAEAE